MLRVLVLACALLCALAVPHAADAQSAPAEIEVRVVDASGKPVGDARVYVSGPLTTSALTPRDGTIRFTDVEPGLYHLRVAAPGYDGVDLDGVEALAGRRKIVDVSLDRTQPKPAESPKGTGPHGELTQIGHVRARPAVTLSSVDVDEGNPIMRVSENLADALDKIAGVTVTQPQQTGTLSISLRNADPSSTTATVGGAAIVGGGAGTLQAVAADLSTGVNVDANGSIADVGGSVNFRTLEPTKTWQQQASFSYGTYEHTSAQFSLSGSAHKLGFAVQHAVRGGDGILSGLRFADTSGETYVHDGGFARLGDFVKLRYAVGGHMTVNAQYLEGTTRNASWCDDFVTTLPCGYGPGNGLTNRAALASVIVQGQVGNVTVSGNLQRNTFHSVDDELGRVVAGVPSPFRSDASQAVTGFSEFSTLAYHRHTFLLSVGSYAGSGTTVSTGRFQGTAPIRSRWAYYGLGDTLKLSDRWSVTLTDGANVNLAQSSNAADLSVALTPSHSETLRFHAGVYGGGTNFVNGGFFADPAAATYNCAAGEVRVEGPSDPPQPGTLHAVSLDYSRRWRRGTLHVSAYQSDNHGGSLHAQFPLLGLDPGAIPAGYLDALAAFWHEPALCGAERFDPGRVYVAEQISGASSRYRGVDASGQLMLGRDVVALPSYSIAEATLTAGDPRLLAPGSPYALGGQLPFRPLHKAGLLIDARQPRAQLEWVVNGTWTSANNTYGLGSYVVAAAGVTWTAQRGHLSLFANNLFNADTGLFATTEFAQPLALQGGGTYLPVPTLLAPRSYTLLYSVRWGRLK